MDKYHSLPLLKKSGKNCFLLDDFICPEGRITFSEQKKKAA
jgi:hypothetical protein